MICPNCKKEFENPSHVCIHCAYYCGAGQGRVKLKTPIVSTQNIADEPQNRETPKTRSGKTRHRRKEKRYRTETNIDKLTRPFHINWAWVTVGFISLILCSLVGIYIFLNFTLQGHVLKVRAGKEGSSEAYWIVGKEAFEKGDITKALSLYEKASESYEISPENLKRMLGYAELHEAAQNIEKALESYQTVYTDSIKMIKNPKFGTDVDQTAKELSVSAYKSAIHLLKNQNRLAEASTLLKEAYEKTENIAFYKERNQIVPLPPTATLPGGPHTFAQKVSFVSEQGYDIYYTLGTEDLPEGGQLFTEPITIDEGVYEFRAVAVSDKLVSDEMKVKYFISLPVPEAPKANRASGTYKKSVIVKLRNLDKDQNLTMYYTVDGSQPTTDSPVYTDAGISLPPGRVRLRAIAENRYGKTSNELVIDYEVGGKFKKYYGEDDVFPKFTLLKTKKDKFIAQYGQPEKSESFADPFMPGSNTELHYPWGVARFTAGEKGEVLYYISTNSQSHGGPRGTKVGQNLNDVIAQFKDMKQPPNTSGSRGLYHEDNNAKGYFKVSEESPKNGNLIYFRVYSREDLSGVFYLYYEIENNKVKTITNYFTPEKISLLEHR